MIKHLFSLSKYSTERVHCTWSGHMAKNCKVCPMYNGKWYGRHYCLNECKWNQGKKECVPKGKVRKWRGKIWTVHLVTDVTRFFLFEPLCRNWKVIYKTSWSYDYDTVGKQSWGGRGGNSGGGVRKEGWGGKERGWEGCFGGELGGGEGERGVGGRGRGRER